jgi:hypothetical protein
MDEIRPASPYALETDQQLARFAKVSPSESMNEKQYAFEDSLPMTTLFLTNRRG